MTNFEFNIPLNKTSLLESNSQFYWVRDVLPVGLLTDELKKAKVAFSNDGPEYILEKFDVYYSVLHHGEKMTIEFLYKTITELHKVVIQLNNNLELVLDDNEIALETRLKNLNILKMLLFIYSSFIVLWCNKIESFNKQNLNIISKGRRKNTKSKSSEEENNIEDKQKCLSNLCKILQKPIHKLWDPPICEELFVNTVSEVGYTFLQCPAVKNETEVKDLIFNVLGILLKNYNHSLTFTIRLVQLVKMKENEYLEAVVPSGIKLLVENFSCRSLVRELVHELTEWQSNEVQDVPGTKHCSNILIEMTTLMPELMIPEVLYLLKYLYYDSYTLRNCVLSITTEVIIKILSNEDMDNEHKEIRDQLLSELEAHISDANAHVRSKVLQNWTKLHSESAIPINKHLDILECASKRLKDKAVLVRKNAIILINSFLKYNPYAAELDIYHYEKEFKKATDKYNTLKSQLTNVTLENIKKKEEEWAKIEDKVKSTIAKKVNQATQDEKLDINVDVPLDNLEELIRTYLNSENYEIAFAICHAAESKFENLRKQRHEMESNEQIEYFTTILYTVFTDMRRNAAALVESALNKVHLTQEQIQSLEQAESEMLYIKDVYDFLKKIDSIIPQMIALLHSSVLSTVTEAIEFFILAHQFKIRNCSEGLTSMLSLMNSNEQDRRNSVTDAYKTIFLPAERKNTTEDNLEIIRTLMELSKSIKLSNKKDFANIFAQWVTAGDIDNSIIECLWHCYTKRIPGITDEESKAALELLVMAGMGRKSIVERNVNLVAETAFSENGINDIHLVSIACQMLTVLGNEEVNVTSKNPPFKIPHEDIMWNNLVKIVVDNFNKNVDYYPDLITSVVELIFKVCRNPGLISEKLIKNVVSLVKNPESNIILDGKMNTYYLTNFVHLLGEIAIKYFLFLDVTVYRELKRRKYLREEHKKIEKQKKTNDKNVTINTSVISASARMAYVEENEENNFETVMADDYEAEFILHICETKIVTCGVLGDFAPFLKNILKNSQKYQDEQLQASTSLAFLRFMIVSSKFCEENIQQIMTILERTPYASVKKNILINMADLLHRFPNIVEPWSPQLYKKVCDPEENVRLTAIKVVTTLIIQDMLRVKGNVSDIALCIVDNTSKAIKEIAKSFFHALAKKGNTIYNILPDIISRLSTGPSKVDEKTFRDVLSFLISLIDKDRIIEPLVEKLCLRFNLSENARQWRDLAFCLSLLSYNEKSLDRLSENYANYKISLEDDEVCQLFFQIIQKQKNASKTEVRNAAKKLENILKTGQEISTNDENTEPNEVFKQPKPRRTKKVKH